jgi:hypothetical protein
MQTHRAFANYQVRKKFRFIFLVRRFTLQRAAGAIIIGARKAGTRALVVFLNLHPGVRAVLTELHYFSSQFHRGVDWYRYNKGI